MARDQYEYDVGGQLRDRYGRRQMIAVTKHQAPTPTDGQQGYEPSDPDGREQVVLLDGGGLPIAAANPLARHYYVLPSGSDTNTGLAWGSPFQTITAALAAAKTAGGGVVHVGPGSYAAPNGRGFSAGSYTTIIGAGVGITVITLSGATNAIGFSNSDAGFGGAGDTGLGDDEIHIRDLTVDGSGASTGAQSNHGVLFQGVRGGSIRRCKIICGGVAQGIDLGSGGNTGQFACKHITVEDNEIVLNGSTTTSGIAITNCEAPVVHGNWIRNTAASGADVMDLESNATTDTEKGVVITGNVFDGNGYSCNLSLNPAAITSKPKVGGAIVANNSFKNGANVNCEMPGAAIVGNTFENDPATVNAFVNHAIWVNQVAAGFMRPDNCIVTGNTIKNFSGGNLNYSAIAIQDARNCYVGPNVVIDDRAPSLTAYAVEEINLFDGCANNLISPQQAVGMLTGHIKRVSQTSTIAPGFAPFGQAWRSQFYYLPPTLGGSIQNNTLVQNRAYAVPFPVAEAAAFDQISINVSTAVAATTIRLGVYNDNGGKPGALLLDAGTVASTATGQQNITLSPTLFLQPGLYWLVAKATGGTPGAYGGPANAAQGIVGQPNITFANNILGQVYDDQAAGALAANFTNAGTNAAPNVTGVALRAA